MRTLSRYIVSLILLLSGSIALSAQTITITGTATDSDGTLWKSGTIQIQFVPNPAYPNMGQYYVDGTTKITDPAYNSLLQQKLSLDNTASFNATLISNSRITPVGSQWKFTVNPLASAGSGIFTVALTNSGSITAALNASLQAPRFLAVAGSYGYNTTEAQTTNAPGATYYDVTNKCQNYYDTTTSTWACPGGGSGSPPAGNVSAIQTNLDNTHFGAGPATLSNTTGMANLSTNAMINVQMYGAKGDCVTDDTTAFNNAQTAAIAFAVGNNLPAVLAIPKPPGGCYIISNWTWQGVSLIGLSEGGLGPASPKTYPVTLKSKPGTDILHIPDPLTTSGTVKIYAGWSIKNIGFLVDNSVAGSFPHRWPGRWASTLSMTSGSAILSDPNGNAHINCGDVGQNIRVKGAGAGGADLITTIVSVSPCFTPPTTPAWRLITLNTAASTTVASTDVYISILGLPVTQNLGNAAIAQDLQDGNSADWVGTLSTGNYGVMQNVSFNTTNGSSYVVPRNYPVAVFTQGQPWLYGIDVHNIFVSGYYIGIAQTTTELNSYNLSSSGDYEKWDHGIFFFNATPWFSVNGFRQRLQDLQITGEAGPIIRESSNAAFDIAVGWKVSNMGFETPTESSPYGWVVAGGFHDFVDVSMTGHGTSPNQQAYWTAYSSRCQQCDMQYTSIGGSNNQIWSSDPPTNVNTIDLGGLGNRITYAYNGNPLDGLPSNYDIASFPLKGYTDVVGRYKGDSDRDGNYSYNYSYDDLMIWPRDLVFQNPTGASPWANYIQQDSTSVSGSYMILAPGTIFATYSQSVGQGNLNQSVFVGSGASSILIPPTGIDIVLWAKCPLGTSSFIPKIGVQGGTLYTTSKSCTTSYQKYVFSLAFTGTDVGKYLIIGSNTGTGQGTFYAASWQIMPWKASINGKSLLAGAGASYVTGPTSSALHNCVYYTDTIGTTGDSGIPCGSGIASIQLSIASFAIPANTCYGSAGSTTPGTVTMTGMTTTSVPFASYSSNASAITGWGITGGLSLQLWPTANTLNYLVCNSTGGSITGGAITFNIGAR